MKQYIDKAAVVAEIDRRVDFFIEESKKGKCDINIATALCGLNAFIDTLEVKEVKEEPVSEDLEEAVENYAATGEVLPNGKVMINFQEEKAFKAGAKWQEEHLIDKACEWLEEHLLDFWSQRITNTDYFIKDFKQAMNK